MCIDKCIIQMFIKYLILFNLITLLYGQGTKVHSEIFDYLTNPQIYNKQLIPDHESPLRINISFFIYSFGGIDEAKTDYKIQLGLRLEWYDNRVDFSRLKQNVSKIEGGAWHSERLWTPPLHIPNNVEPGTLQHNDHGPLLVQINSDGHILLSRRTQLQAYCKMNFRLYPLDRQYCNIEIESSILSEKYLLLGWREENPFDLPDVLTWSGFIIKNYTLIKTESVYSHTGAFSKLIVRFTLDREFGHFFLDIYLPAIIFVITSWTAFWVEIPAAPARVSLGITSMLTLVTSAKSSREKLPPVSYINALDMWNLICTFFVFATLVQYATVNNIYNKDKRCKKRRRALQNSMSCNSLISLTSEPSLNNTPVNSPFLKPSNGVKKRMFNNGKIREGTDGGIELVVPPANHSNNFNTKRNEKTDAISVKSFSLKSFSLIDYDKSAPIDIANNIDRKCRIIFPICFVVFNAVYWITLALLSYY